MCCYLMFFGVRAQEGDTALIWAGFNGHADCARLLLDAGADKTAANKVRMSVGGCVRAFWRGAVVMM